MRERHYIKLLESQVDDEYNRKYSTIDRDVFNNIVKADPKSRIVDNELVGIGFGAKQLLLPSYLKGDISFLDDIEDIKELLNKYYANQSSYPAQFRNLGNFASIDAFKQFVNNPEENTSDEIISNDDSEEGNPIDNIYNKYYNKIPREIFNNIIAMDPTTTESKLGTYAKNLLLPKYLAGDTEFLSIDKKVKKAIEQFISDSSTYPEEKQNIQSYNSVQDFINFVTSGPESAYVSQLKNSDKINPNTGRLISSELNFIASTPQYEIIQPLSTYANNAITGGGWHDNDAMHWCTADPGMSYWKSYSNKCNIYCFMHKTKYRGTENKRYNWQVAITKDSNPRIYDFRDGYDTGSSNYEEKFYKFLLAHPDICNAISDKKPFSEVDAVRRAVATQSILEDGLKISKASDFEKLLSLQPQGGDEAPIGVKEITIENVKEIPAGILAGMSLLEKVTFGPGLEVINAQAFKDCVNLNGIRFPESLRIIGYEAFMGCTGLKNNINIPNSVEEIKGGAFMDCHCKLTVEKKREELGLPLKLAKSDEDWYIKHLRGINS